jgi:uncharacterized protein with HEPN domain
MPKRVDKLLIEDIVKAIEELHQFTEGFTFETFIADAKTKAAVIRNLEIIGEASSVLSIETIIKYPQIEWRQMKQLRNNLIHEYFGIDYEIVWNVLQKHIPYNYEFLKKIAL